MRGQGVPRMAAGIAGAEPAAPRHARLVGDTGEGGVVCGASEELPVCRYRLDVHHIQEDNQTLIGRESSAWIREHASLIFTLLCRLRREAKPDLHNRVAEPNLKVMVSAVELIVVNGELSGRIRTQ